MKLNTKLWVTIPSVIIVGFGVLLTFHFSANSEGISSNQGLMSSMGISRVKENVKAPDFMLKDLEGKSVQLSGLLGKVVLINFWTTW